LAPPYASFELPASSPTSSQEQYDQLASTVVDGVSPKIGFMPQVLLFKPGKPVFVIKGLFEVLQQSWPQHNA